MNISEKILTSAIVAVLIIVGYVAWSSRVLPKLGNINSPVYGLTTQGGALCASSGSTLLLATSSSRNFTTISNTSPIGVFLSFGIPAAPYKGLYLAASSSYTIDANHAYIGAIYCSGLGGTASTTYSDSAN